MLVVVAEYDIVPMFAPFALMLAVAAEECRAANETSTSASSPVIREGAEIRAGLSAGFHRSEDAVAHLPAY